MIHLFLNALAASAGAGLTYIRNVIPELASRNDVRVTVALGRGLREGFLDADNLTLVEIDSSDAIRRFWYEQTRLAEVIRQTGAQVLISAGNFAMRKSPVPQILLSGNSLYTSSDFYRDLRARGAYGMWLDTRMRAIFARRSVHWADVTVAPSRAFADVLHDWTGCNVTSIYHGFDQKIFFSNGLTLPDETAQKVLSSEGALKLLFVSHYNYYRNFETLFRGLSLLKERLKNTKVKLLLTCKLQSDANPGSYRTEHAAALVNELGIAGEVVELGAVPYGLLHHVYRAADIYVTPAYAETFAHPLVEAMASGIPIVAADTAVHREICGGAAVYFPAFSPEALAAEVVNVAESQAIRKQLVESGSRRAQDFSWQKHVDQILECARALCVRAD
jgi:glycosyltransferase involved in cell wall biosynthesis